MFINMQVLRKRPTISVHGGSVRQGLSDIALFNDDARYAEGKYLILIDNLKSS